MITLRSGDIFCTANPMWLGRAINVVQKFWALDNHSEYSHAGIITGSAGKTFESLWTIRVSDLDQYIGKKILIGRNPNLSLKRMKNSIIGLYLKHNGQWYPFWRLAFHLFPPAAKWISSGRHPVCSELVCKMLVMSGMSSIGRWQGKTPDNVADMINKWDAFNVIYEGIWRQK